MRRQLFHVLERRHAEEISHNPVIIGMKSYGRAPTFLLLTGYEQARSVVSAIAGDWEAVRRVELVLPEAGVCSTDAAIGDAPCCGTVPDEPKPVSIGLGSLTQFAPPKAVLAVKEADKSCC